MKKKVVENPETKEAEKQAKKLRIFINSNADWATSGYAMQLSEMLDAWQAEGYPIGVCAFHGLEGGIIEHKGRTYYPKINHLYGSDALVHHARDFQADVCFTLQDIWVLHPQDLQNTNRFIPIVPIDHRPVPQSILNNLKFAYRIVTYSQFGHDELLRHGLHSTYIQHTVDTDVFKPLDRSQNKGFPEGSYVVGMVSANKENPPRKSFQEAMDAFKLFKEKVPNAVLYLHTRPEFPGGFPVREYANFIGIINSIFFPDEYMMNFKYGKTEMAKVYNHMDMLLCPSINEGFGVPIIEAQACGVPVVVNNSTSMPELIRNHVTGEVCDVVYNRFDAIQSFVQQPSHTSIFDCMMRIYNRDKEEQSRAARAFMVENYDTKKIMKEKWFPFLEKLEKEVYS